MITCWNKHGYPFVTFIPVSEEVVLAGLVVPSDGYTKSYPELQPEHDRLYAEIGSVGSCQALLTGPTVPVE